MQARRLPAFEDRVGHPSFAASCPLPSHTLFTVPLKARCFLSLLFCSCWLFRQEWPPLPICLELCILRGLCPKLLTLAGARPSLLLNDQRPECRDCPGPSPSFLSFVLSYELDVVDPSFELSVGPRVSLVTPNVVSCSIAAPLRVYASWAGTVLAVMVLPKVSVAVLCITDGK